MLQESADVHIGALAPLGLGLLTVLASTATLDLEKKRELEAKCDDVGMDFFFLGLATDAPSPMGALAVTFWDEVSSEFLTSSEDSAAWAANLRGSRKVGGLVEFTRQEIKEGLGSRKVMAVRSAARFRRSLFPLEKPPMGTAVIGTKYVRRSELATEMDRWWNQPGRPLLVMGEERMGKSWAVAGWVRDAQFECPVVWLDSNRWCDCRRLLDLVDLVAEALAGGFGASPRKRERIENKIVRRWASPTCLVVLDGANEREASYALESLLSEYYSTDGEDLRERLKLIVTTRPLPLVPSRTLGQCQRIKVGPFSDRERERAVSLASDGQLSADEMPPGLAEIARRPGFLELCLRLRSDFRSFDEVTVEAVLFMRLQQVLDEKRRVLGIEPEEGIHRMGRLIELTTQRGEFRVLEESSSLTQLMPDAKHVVYQLQDAGWLQDFRGGRKAVAKTHVRLGWALFFLRLANRGEEMSLLQHVEALRTCQEPGLDDDLRSDSMGIALELSVRRLKDRDPRATACLFAAWLLSHNSRLKGPQFESILENDPEGYCSGVEAIMRLARRSQWVKFFTKPIMKAWEKNDRACNAIRGALSRWLQFWAEAPASPNEISAAGSPSEEEEFRRWSDLQSIALRILGYRPELELVPTLCRYVGSFSRSQGEEWRHRRITAVNQVGFLLRWTYGERALRSLRAIVSSPQSSSAAVEAARSLARSLRQTNLPEVLRREANVYRAPINRWWVVQIDDITLGRSGILSELSPEKFCETNWASQIAELAGDPSIPDLGDADCRALRAGLRTLIEAGRIRRGGGGETPENRVFKTWVPWLARLDPEEWYEIVTTLAKRALDGEKAQWTLQEFPVLGVWRDSSRVASKLQATIARAITEEGKDLRENRGLDTLFRWALHIEDRDRLMCCLRIMADCDAQRYRSLLQVLTWALDEASFKEAGERRARVSQDFQRRFWFVAEWAFSWRLPAAEAAEWCKEVAPFVETSEELLRTLFFRRLRAIDHDDALEQLLAKGGRLVDPWEEETARHVLSNAKAWGRLDQIERLYPEFIDSLSLAKIGTFFFEVERAEELRKWGLDLFSMALESRGEAAEGRPANGARIGAPMKDSIGGSRDLLKRMEVPTAWEVPFDWSRGPLRAWARLEPQKFLEAARTIVNSVDHRSLQHPTASGFVEAVLLVWQELEPFEAYRYLRRRTPNKFVDNGIPNQIMRLWDLEACVGLGHRELRLHQLRSCPSDLDVALHGLAARWQGAEAEIESVARDLLEDNQQLERSLGVSLIAWHPEGAGTLECHVKEDPSLWVRAHAGWASEVCRREQLGRQLYLSALRAESWLEQQASLERLVPLVMATFEIWAYHDEELLELMNALEPRRKALLIDARYNLRRRINWQQMRVCGRDLKKFCRGEDLTFRLEAGETGPPWLGSSAD